jgi:hypothetical protein
MKYLKKYNEHKNISIFDQDWKKLLPKKLEIITSNGEFELEKSDLAINGTGDLLQISYFQQTVEGPNDSLDDGEPDYLEFDICLTKSEKSLKMSIDITYGDAMMFEFSIEPPNKIIVAHYNGIGSLYDPKTKFAFSDKSLKELVDFFNRFNHGLKLKVEDFKFLDKKDDSYKFDNEVKSVSARPEYNGQEEVKENLKDMGTWTADTSGKNDWRKGSTRAGTIKPVEQVSNYTLDQIPNGEYKGSIKGYYVYMDSIDSGFRATTGWRNMFPILCTVYVENGTAVAYSKAGINFSDDKTEEEWKKKYGMGVNGMKNDPRMKPYLKK